MNIHTVDWQDAKARQDFVDLPWQLYAPAAWVPPLKASVAQELGPENLFFGHGRAAIFVAERDGEIIGRIVASVDDQLQDQDVGHFGYFESVDDPDVARALLTAAEDWLRSQGKNRVHGPINLNIYNTYRVQTHGFDTQPFLGEPRSLPYYPGLFEAAGYTSHARWNSWDIPSAALPMLQGYMQQKAQNLPPEYHLKTLKNADEAGFLADLHQVAMAIFAENYGYAALDYAEFLQAYQGLLSIFRMHPVLLGLFYDRDQPVGFGFIYPDYAPFFSQANGDITALAGFADYVTQGMVFHTFGFLKNYRHTALPYLGFAESFGEVQKYGHRYAFGALAKEGRTAYDQLGQPTRSYAVFEKALA